MTISFQFHRDRRVRNAGILAGVTAAHVAVFFFMAQTEPSPPMPLPLPPIQVELVRPVQPPPPPPPPPPEPASDDPGGGAPAAPSRVHVPPPPPRPVPPELPAPRQLAPEQTPVLGVAPIASPTPGMGQGGQGTGAGSGTGAGDGPGRGGVRTPPQNLRRPGSREILAYVPAEARRQRVSGTANVRCRIREDQRLDRCFVVSEDPSGFGFGDAAIRVAEGEYRFRPPTLDGRYQDDITVTITVEFGRQAPRG